MYEFNKNGKAFTSKSVGTGPSSYEERIYRAAVSRRLRDTGLGSVNKRKISCPLPGDEPLFIRRQPHSSVTTRSLSLTRPVANTEITDVTVHATEHSCTRGGPAGQFPRAPAYSGR